MKTFVITLFSIAIFITSSYSQTVNDIPINDIDVEYVQIVGTSKFMSNKVTIEIDFGQENKFWSNKQTIIKDESGKPVVFNSMIDALNFMSANGYEFETAYALTVSNANVYHFLLKRRED